MVDIGGSGIKALIVNEIGEPMTKQIRESTPRGGKPDDVIKVIRGLAKENADGSSESRSASSQESSEAE